jgi:predicted glycogen debranching enzyme
MLIFDQVGCRDLSTARRREWIETNGIGGYASSTIVGLNTRRYHGLLVAATRPPVGRMVLLSKMEETVIIRGHRYDLSTNRYPGAIYPAGYELLKEFRLDPFPTFVYEVEGLEVEKQVFLVYGHNTVVIEYDFRRLDPGLDSDVSFELRPLIAFRDYHSTTRWNDALDPAFAIEGDRVTLTPYQGVPFLHIAFGKAQIEKVGDWYYNFERDAEFERGFYDNEDLFNPLVSKYSLGPGDSVSVIASLERHGAAESADLRGRELQRRAELERSSRHFDPLTVSLTTAADQFIVKRGDLDTIIAGYHWFGDWGRDTMIALPGLTLAAGRAEVARSILETFARHIDQGMLPNRFPDDGAAPEYNTVDAALWMFEAAQAYANHTEDWSFVEHQLYDALAGVIDWYERGTRFGIKVDVDGLVQAGAAGSQLTWMDAKVGDVVATPRQGKPVEIQALWYNALRIVEEFARRFGRASEAAAYAMKAELTRRSFNDAFWYGDGGYLYDVIDGDRRDASLRPNQILAVSLSHSMLESVRAGAVVATVERDLLTPRGLRSLAPSDPSYRGRYVGDAATRDMTYHQGTVWPWLAGPFFTAWLKTHGSDETSREAVRAWLAQFSEHLSEAGLGQVSEIFDGDAPFEARGCIAQAWSVAELLRVAVALADSERYAPTEPKVSEARGARKKTGAAESPVVARK